MKKFLLLSFIVLLLCGCSSKKESNSYKDIMNNNDYLIIDVRTEEEYQKSHVKDAINIPYDEINEDSDISKDKVIFVYCKSGGRSAIAYETLKNLGYEVYDLGAFESIDLPKE